MSVPEGVEAHYYISFNCPRRLELTIVQAEVAVLDLEVHPKVVVVEGVRVVLMS